MSQQSNFRNRAVVERAGVHYRSIRHGVSPVTRESQPSPGLAAGAFSLLAVVGVRARSDAGAGAGQFHAHAARPRRRGDRVMGWMAPLRHLSAKLLSNRISSEWDHPWAR